MPKYPPDYEDEKRQCPYARHGYKSNYLAAIAALLLFGNRLPIAV